MLKSEKNILQRCDVRSPWKESSIVFILQKAKKNISSQCQRLNKKASMASLENSLCLGVLSALLAPTKRKLPKARLCNKMHWMSFYWLRARTVWCLSSKNRLECLITVIKRYQDFTNLTFPFWQTPNCMCELSIVTESTHLLCIGKYHTTTDLQFVCFSFSCIAA